MEVCRLQVLLVFFMVYVKGNVSAESPTNLTAACGTILSAKTTNEEIAKLFKTVSVFELVEPYTATWYEKEEEKEDPFNGCFNPVYDSRGRKTTLFKKNVCGILIRTATTLRNFEKRIIADESLKKSITDVAELFKNSWLKIRKILRLNLQFFEMFDMFVEDTVMQKTANMSSKAHEQNLDESRLHSYESDYHLEFTKVYHLMISMTMRRSLRPDEFIRNVVKSQVHSAMYDTKYLATFMKDNKDRYKVFTEISIKENIKKASKNLFEAYVLGYDDANAYVEKQRDLEKMLNQVIEKVDAYTPVKTKSCKTVREEAIDLITGVSELDTMAESGEGAQIFQAYDTKLATWFEKKVNLVELMNQVRQAMSYVSEHIPRYGDPELEELYLYVTSKADQSVIPRFKSKSIGFGSIHVYHLIDKDWFKHYDKLEEMLNKVLKLHKCYLKVYQFFGQTFQSCSEGVGTLREIYDEISSRIQINVAECWFHYEFGHPSFHEIKKFIDTAAYRVTSFNKDCKKNNQQDEPGDVRSIVIDDYSDESEKEKFSPSQRFMVCNLRGNWSKSDEEINDMMAVRDLQKVKAVRCKDSKRADSKYAREKQVDNA